MTNDFIYKYVLFLANKAVTGNNPSPEDFNIALNASNLKHFKKKTGIPEEYRVGMPISRQSFEVTQIITDDVLPFKIHMGDQNTPPLSVNSNGYADIPSDFFYPSALSHKYFPNTDCTGSYILRPIDVLTDSQWDHIAGSAIRMPTLMYPACNFQNGVIRFLPKDIQRVDFVYLKLPETPVYDYYINADGEHIYMIPGESHVLLTGEQGSAGQTSGTVTSLSVELEWHDINKLDIVSLILSNLGINQREISLQQYAEMNKQTGV
jgi:hypothetical protein